LEEKKNDRRTGKKIDRESARSLFVDRDLSILLTHYNSEKKTMIGKKYYIPMNLPNE
jgi:hypothetical protein